MHSCFYCAVAVRVWPEISFLSEISMMTGVNASPINDIIDYLWVTECKHSILKVAHAAVLRMLGTHERIILLIEHIGPLVYR